MKNKSLGNNWYYIEGQYIHYINTHLNGIRLSIKDMYLKGLEIFNKL